MSSCPTCAYVDLLAVGAVTLLVALARASTWLHDRRRRGAESAVPESVSSRR